MIFLLNLLGIEKDIHVVSAIPGVFSFLGILLTGLLALFTYVYRQTRERREKTLDLRQAIHAEIQIHWMDLKSGASPDFVRNDLKKRFSEEGSEKFQPVFSALPTSIMFDQLQTQIHLLNPEEIRPVIRYYHHLRTVQAFATELRGEFYRNLPSSTRLQMALDLVSMFETAEKFAEEAMKPIENSAPIGTDQRFQTILSNWKTESQ